MMLSLMPEHQEQPVSGIALLAWAIGTGHSIHDRCSVCVCVCMCLLGGGMSAHQQNRDYFLPLHLISTDFPSGHWWHSGKRPKHPMQREGGKRVRHSS